MQVERHLPTKAIESELTQLLRSYDEFHDSETYLTRVASLAAICQDWDRAYVFSADAVELNPSRELRYRLAEVCLSRGTTEDAVSIWRELSNQGHLLSTLRLAEQAVSNSDFETAGSWLKNAKEIDETDWRVQMFAGTFALIVGDHRSAVTHFRAARTDRPNSVRLYYNLALAHVLSGHTQHALKALRIAVGLNPYCQKALVAWADLSVHCEQTVTEVSKALSRYVDLQFDDKSAVERLAYLHYLQEDFGGSRSVLTKARDKFNDPAFSNNLGVVAKARGDLRTAIQEFNRAVRSAAKANQDQDQHQNEKTTDIATVNLVTALNDKEQFEQVEEIAEAYILLSSDRKHLEQEPTYRISEGLVYACLHSGKTKKAVSLAESWIDQPIHPKLKASLASTIVCFYTLMRQQPKKAYNYAMLAYESQRNEPGRDSGTWNMIINNLAFASIECGRLGEAEHYAAQLRTDGPKERQYVFAIRGFLAIRLGQVARGEGLYRRAISLANTHNRKSLLRFKLNWELAKFWAERGDKNRAMRLLKKVRQARLQGVWTMPYIMKDAARLEDRLRSAA